MHILNLILEKFGVGRQLVVNASDWPNANTVEKSHGNCTLTISTQSWTYKQVLPIGTVILNDFSKAPYRLYVSSATPGKLKMKRNNAKRPVKRGN